ncbi:hypothetical protein GCM10007962_08530 [Yeosuana aromativorans]|uniref:Uncharacterized protein n=1 Tax=Yeosuana aromativorans TaxID=288019 RepID=A0A8J3BK70_9FLAO|nr:hypothetical protein [Yeosuana aromativorans]GGK16473.1 hypothetical protein GCM10007962_08530 [Yeosuana aromativorans]
MDIGTTIIGVVLAAICLLPFFLISRGRKKREEKTIKSLMDIAKQQDCQINQYELCNNLIIGMDKNKNVLLFKKDYDDIPREQLIYLSEIQSCKVVEISRTIKNKSATIKLIDRLELMLIPNNKSKPEIKLEFFNVEKDFQLNGQLQLINKWSKEIKDQLKSN